MDLILTIRNLITALRARDFAAARKLAAKLLRLVADQIDAGPNVIGDSPDNLAAAVADLEAAIDEAAPEPVIYGANGEYLKKMLALLLKLLPLFL